MAPQTLWSTRDVSAWLLLQGGGFFVPLVAKLAYDHIDGKRLLALTKDDLSEYGVTKKSQTEVFFERLTEDKNEDLQVNKKLKSIEGKDEGATSVVEDWSCEHVLLWLLSMGGVFLSLIEGFEKNRVNGKILSEMNIEDFMAYGLNLVESKCVFHHLLVKLEDGHNFSPNFKRLLIRHAEKKRMEKERLSASMRSAFDAECVMNQLPEEGPSFMMNNNNSINNMNMNVNNSNNSVATNDGDIMISPILVMDHELEENQYMKFPSLETDSGDILISPLMERASSIESVVSSVMSVGSTPDNDIAFVISPIMDKALSMEHSRETDDSSEFGEESDVEQQIENFSEAITSQATEEEKSTQVSMIPIRQKPKLTKRLANLFQQRNQFQPHPPQSTRTQIQPHPKSQPERPTTTQSQSQFISQQPRLRSRLTQPDQLSTNSFQNNSNQQESNSKESQQNVGGPQRKASFDNNPLRIAQILSKQKETSNQEENLENEEEDGEEEGAESSFLQFDRKAQPDFINIRDQQDRNRDRKISSSSSNFILKQHDDFNRIKRGNQDFQFNQGQSNLLKGSIFQKEIPIEFSRRIQPAFQNRKIRDKPKPFIPGDEPKQRNQIFSRPPLLEHNKNQRQIEVLQSDGQSLSKQFQQMMIEGGRENEVMQIEQEVCVIQNRKRTTTTQFEVGQVLEQWLQHSEDHELHKSRIEIEFGQPQAPKIQKLQSFTLRPTFMSESSQRKEGEVMEDQKEQEQEQALYLRQYFMQATNAVAFYQSMGTQYCQLIQFISLVGTQLIIDVYTLAMVTALDNFMKNHREGFRDEFEAVHDMGVVHDADIFTSEMIAAKIGHEFSMMERHRNRNIQAVC